LPYGEKTADFLIERARKITRYFKDNGITTIVIACHTSAATSLKTLEKEFPEITFIDPLPITTDNAVKITKNGRIAIMATERSISTGIHKKLLHKRDSNVTAVEQACPLLVPLIENNGSEEEINAAIELYTKKLRALKADTVILGCTHYPFIEQQIQHYLPKATFVSAASAIKYIIKAGNFTAKKNQNIQFVVSGDTEKIKPLLEKYVVKKKGLSVSITPLERPYN